MKSKEIEDYIYQSDIELYSKVYKTIEDEYSKMDIKTFIELVEKLDSISIYQISNSNREEKRIV